jgi:hypothetical protein
MREISRNDIPTHTSWTSPRPQSRRYQLSGRRSKRT